MTTDTRFLLSNVFLLLPFLSVLCGERLFDPRRYYAGRKPSTDR